MRLKQLLQYEWGRNGVVGTATSYGIDGRGFDLSWRYVIFSSSKLVHTYTGPLPAAPNVYRGLP